MPRKNYPPPATLGPGRKALTKRQRAEGIARWAELLHPGKRGRYNRPSLPDIDVKAEQTPPTPRNNPPTPKLFQGNELPAKTNPKAKPGKTHRRGTGKATRPATKPTVSIDTRGPLEARGRSEPATGPTAQPTAGAAPVPPATPTERPPPATQLRSDGEQVGSGGDQVVTPLEPKEQRFVEEFLLDMNAAGAARRAGYSKASAKQLGSRLLTKVNVQDAIAKAREALSAKLQVTLEDITRELTKIGFGNIGDYFYLTGGGDPYIDLSDCTRDQLAALQQLTVKDYVEGRGEDARMVKEIGVKLGDKKGSLGLLSDLLGYSPKRQVNLTGSVKVEKVEGDSLAVAVRRMETSDLLAYDALGKQQEALLAKSRPPPPEP